ncbi:MAG: hypothetical protein HS132_10245 [Planctomycetia bacterium]|nr:hypothetical protein [Planctomycetia bacterium]
MSNYRRVRIPGVTYFFTVVTYKRLKILTMPESRQILRAIINEVQPGRVAG